MNNPKPRILYVAFVDLDKKASSGSSVRPQQMKRAFEELGCTLVVLQGLHNRRAERKQRTHKIIKQLEDNSLNVDFCYIEPPSGPFFCVEDLKLIKLLHKKKIPVGLFYRDAYWLANDGYNSGGMLKSSVIKALHKRDLRVFEKCCSIIYVPSESFASFVGFKNKTKALPPACPSIIASRSSFARNTPTAIFVGSATKEYGIFLILEAFRRINAGATPRVKLIIVCPEGNWNALPKEYQRLSEETWLDVHHAKGSEQLAPHYASSDFALLPYIQIPYNDMAMPVKLFEYVAYEKPIITTNCTEKARFVEDWGIGIVCEDNPDSFAEAVTYYLENPELQDKYAQCLTRAHQNNLWTTRAKQVVEDLTGTSQT